MSFSSLTDVPVARHYNSDEVDVLEQFYRPLLQRAVRYDRAVGYFSSSTLRSCAQELLPFVERDGRIRLVIGCLISHQDVDALSAEALAEHERLKVKAELHQQLRNLQEVDLKAATLLSRLVAAGIVDIRFAVRTRGIYHEKFGVFADAQDAKVAFIGSANETAAALGADGNHESIAVFKSSEPGIYAAYGQELERRFEDLWAGRTKGTRIVGLDDESLALMRTIASAIKDAGPESPLTLPALEARYELRPYQLEALRAWSQNDAKGILAMATGTGKTLTAIQAVKSFRERLVGGVVVIAVPYQNLALQWIDALREQGLPVQAVFSSHTEWYESVKNYFLAAQFSQLASMPCFVCVNDTFREDRFQGLLEQLRQSKQPHNLLIADECHHFNSPEHIKTLPNHFTMRLGLSATPYDQFASHYLDEYFSRIVFEFPLGRAIREGFLTPYRYHVIPVALDDEETEQYELITHKIVKIAGGEDGFTPDVLAKVQPLLLARSRIVGAARDKLEQLERHLTEKGRSPFTLFYCGDGSTEEAGIKQRQIELVSKLLHRLGWRSSRITAQESLKEREGLLDSLRRQTIDAVVSIKVLDEGIDIPSCRTAYLLASQRSDRQGIQRRGRVLRKSEGKEIADLYDFLVVDGANGSSAITSLARKELNRAWSFAADAANRDSICTALESIAQPRGITTEEFNARPQ